jgi:hypothetical protein
MTTDTQPRVKLRSPADIIDAVPYLVGFEPHESLVVLSLRGPRSQLGLTARIDLPGAKSATACARNFVGYLKRDGAARAIVVLYPASGGLSHPSVKPLAAALTKHLGRARIEVIEVLCVCDGRWWSIQCANVACCPPSGTPIARGTTSELAAAMTVEGRVVLGSREELAHMLDPVGGALAAAMVYAIPRVTLELVERRLTGRPPAEVLAEVDAESRELFRAAVQARLPDAVPLDAPPGDLTVDEAARLIVALDSFAVRDEVLTWYDGDWGAATRILLLDLARRSVLPFQAAALTVLGWVCYLQGEGVLAGIAADRALTVDPGYSLAVLLDQVLVGAVNPSLFHDTIASPEFQQLLEGGGDDAFGRFPS